METATVFRLPNRFQDRVNADVVKDPTLRVFAAKFFSVFPEMDIVGLRAVARVFEKVARPFLAPEDVAALLDHDESPGELIEQQVDAVLAHDHSGGGLHACLAEIADMPEGTTDIHRELYAVALMGRLHALADVCRLIVLERD